MSKGTRYANVPNAIAQLEEVNRARILCDLKPFTLEEWLTERRFRNAGNKKASAQPKRYQNND